MDQPIKKVAIVGATGNVGTYITSSLLSASKHTITALTRLNSSSTNTFPPNLIVKKVDYSNHSDLVEVLKGQDALIITLGGMTPHEVEEGLVKAAAEAGVKWILPSEWGVDTADEGLVGDVFVFKRQVAIRNLIASLGKSSYIAVVTGFWYEWSLAIPSAFGFDLQKKNVTFFDDGETKIASSTWPQVGRVVAALLSLPSTSLDPLKNTLLYTNSFTLSQKEMFASVLRTTSTSPSDWSISYQPSIARYAEGIKEMKEGKRMGFAKMMYTRVFYQDGNGDFESRRGTKNGLLRVEKEGDEALDEATRRAEVRSQKPLWVDEE